MPPKRVIAPYPKSKRLPNRSRVRRDTRNPVGIQVDHHQRLNTDYEPIVNQYREGKVKRTPRRGVKKYLKPCAYKRS